MECHVEVDEPSALVGQDHEAVEKPEGDGGYDEEVAGRGAVKMVPKERTPGL